MTALIDYSLDELLEALDTHKRYLSDDQVLRIHDILRSVSLDDDSIGADSKAIPADKILNGLMQEIQHQLEYVTKLRKSVTSRTSTTQEMKNMVQATSSLFTMLTKMNTEISNQDRLRKVELATVAAVNILPEDAQNVFFTELERLLEKAL